MDRFERHYLLWGKEGQEVLRKSCLAIFGADRLSFEAAKSAAILGIGHVIIFDDCALGEKTFILDVPFPAGASRPESAAAVIRLLAPRAYVDAVHPQQARMVLGMLRPDVIMDASLDLGRSSFGWQYAEKHCIPFLSAAMDANSAQLSSHPLDAYANGMQGVILSNLLGGVMVDLCKEYVFKKNIDAFSGLKRWDHGRLHSLQDIIEATPPFEGSLSYDLCRRGQGRSPACRGGEADLQGSSILIVGGGSIGSHLADMLSRLRPSCVDVMDDDRYERRNLGRQPLAYDAIGEHKASALAAKMDRISDGSIATRALLGKASFHGGPSSFGEAWFADHPYDFILGCVDNNESRLFLNGVATALGRVLIDAGSSPTAARVNVYVPGKTSCVDCANLLKGSVLAPSRDMPVARRAEGRVVNRRGCTYQEGSIVMENQIAASMALIEARLVRTGQDGLVDSVRYSSSSRQRFSESPAHPCIHLS